MILDEKSSKRRLCILGAVQNALDEVEYHQLTIEDVAARAGVGKSTIYRWWGHKSELVLDAFKEHTRAIFNFDFDQNLEKIIFQHLSHLSLALSHPIGRAALVVIANHRELAAQFFKQYLLPRRVQMHDLIAQAITRGELVPNENYDLILDQLYGSIHYQIIFFNNVPDEQYIRQLIKVSLEPLRT
jgi:AcrR family transcriptional regulator